MTFTFTLSSESRVAGTVHRQTHTLTIDACPIEEQCTRADGRNGHTEWRTEARMRLLELAAQMGISDYDRRAIVDAWNSGRHYVSRGLSLTWE